MTLTLAESCSQENCLILKELVDLRAQKAGLLGFNTHADFVLEMNMAKSSRTVASFLGRALSAQRWGLWLCARAAHML